MLISLLKSAKAAAAVFISYHRARAQFPDLMLEFPCKFTFDDPEAIEMGRDISIGPFSELVVLKRSPSSTVGGGLLLGNRCVIGAHANIRACGGKIRIGQNALLAQNVTLLAANHSLGTGAPYRDLPWDEEKTGVVIGENVWIGAGVTIVPGISIGNNSVVGAGSVVTRSIPVNELWAGVPARKIRSLGLSA